MENLLVVVGLFNFYNIVSNDVIIEKKHDILTKKNLLIYSEYITKKYNISSQHVFKKKNSKFSHTKHECCNQFSKHSNRN